MNRQDWIITKRQLGLLFVAVGVVGFIALIGLDLIRGRSSDFGPTQMLALVGCAVLVVVGLTLLPLGSHPA